jgi:hypothetical protein
VPEILDWKDAAGTRIFDFVRITPDEEIFTYMVGYPVWEMSKRMESGAGRVKVPEGSTF